MLTAARLMAAGLKGQTKRRGILCDEPTKQAMTDHNGAALMRVAFDDEGGVGTDVADAVIDALTLAELRRAIPALLADDESASSSVVRLAADEVAEGARAAVAEQRVYQGRKNLVVDIGRTVLVNDYVKASSRMNG